MIKRIKNKVFQKIHTGNLVYNTCWEDPRCDRALLDLNAESRLVMLTSAGCNALDYLLDAPRSIDCVDMNPRQNALLDLKKTFFQQTDHDTLFQFFGAGQHPQAEAVFRSAIQDHLTDFAQQYWHQNWHFFAGKGLRNRFYWHGSAGTAAFVVKSILEINPATKRLLHQLFDCEDLAAQQACYAQLEPRVMHFFTRWLFNRHVFQSMLGVPEIQQQLAKKSYRDGMAGYVQQCFRKVFTGQSLRDNYFWKVYLLGSYSSDCCPNYLQSNHFYTLQNRVNRLQSHTATLSQFLQNNPGQYTHFILLDHQDWMAAHNRPALEEEWQLILDNAAPHAKILLRSAAETVDFIPTFAQEKLRLDTEKVAKIQAADRVGTYASTLLATVN